MCHWGCLIREPLTAITPDPSAPVLPGFGLGGGCSGGADAESGPGTQSPQVRWVETETIQPA